ncbi:MAG: phosphoribosylformylglycinamidine synthase subunit PurS [Planctomycetota bacterium]|nr:MAG: phosphoribosylformylglycinamidine synthase subunit PurS [Planctomycetota bacterium]
MSLANQKCSTLFRITISPKQPELDARGMAILHDIHELGLPHIKQVTFSRLFLLQGNLSQETLESIATGLLTDPITEIFGIGNGQNAYSRSDEKYNACAEVHLKGGVMDTVAASTLAALTDMGVDTQELELSTARLYKLAGVASLAELEYIARQLLYNDCIEDVYLTGFGRNDLLPDHLPIAPTRPFELKHVPIRNLSDDQLNNLSRDGHLFLSLPEMRAIQDHYRQQQRDPTDLELEMFAQTWSEHCVHKTLKSAVRYRGAPLPQNSQVEQKILKAGTVEVTYDNLLKDTIARATMELMESGRVDWCLSVFEDNAGVIALDNKFGIAFKVETHNHPSAIEPYGGAATGVGGCIRDVMGCGLGAKPIANTDIFCVGQPDFPMKLLPKGVLHPRRILKGVVTGVRDYGNRMGIPTINGAIVFDNRYLGNPLVFCGCVGLIPRDCVHKQPRPGDLIVVIGGRTGRDGIHGATFSSAELTDTHADEFSHAVQIGNAITEKKVLDTQLKARDHQKGCLYNATTDCGAGGLSSAVGEMGSKLGADVELENVPLKYAGLRYDEIWISEAQERMVFSVPPQNWESFAEICKAENVEATVIGHFRDDGRLIIRYQSHIVGDIDTHFLHNAIPKTQKEAAWTPPAVSSSRQQESSLDVCNTLLAKLAELNTASKEWVIRQYDHEVQGASVIKPLCGTGEGPSDAAVIRPLLESNQGTAISNGISPELSEVDPYWMAVAGIDEAIRNVVCVGGNPKRTAILDNFCWGNCEDLKTMGALVRACQGCYDAAVTYGTPFISGKDSLNNEFALDADDARQLADRIKLYNNRIRIPETLLISAVSIIDDVNKCVTMDAKQIDNTTTHFFFVGLPAKQWPDVDINQAAALHIGISELIASGIILAAHDCGPEGILPALAEMALAGQCGLKSWLDPKGDLSDPFAPIPVGYILQTTQKCGQQITKLTEKLEGVAVRQIAQSQPNKKFSWGQSDTPEAAPNGQEFEINVQTLADAWRSSFIW